MTVSELFAYVDHVKQNAFTDSDKLVWLNEIEARIQTEVMLRWQGEMEQYTLPEDKDTELLLSPPHTAVYRYWLQAMIDFENGEYDKYQNTSGMFNAAWSAFVAWFAEIYRPADGYAAEGSGE